MAHHAKAPAQGSTEFRGKRPGSFIAALALAICALVPGAAPALAAPPTVTVPTVSDVSYASAHVHGEFDGIFASYAMQYSTDGATWDNVPGSEGFALGLEHRVVDLDFTGLKGGTTYFLRMQANNFSDPEVLSAQPDPQFTTLPVDPPAVLSIANASEPLYTVAGASGEVNRPTNPDPAFDANCNFEYISDAQFEENVNVNALPGFTSAQLAPCESTDPANSPGKIAAPGDTPVTARLTNLAPGTTYHLRLSVDNAGGSDSKEAATFTTVAGPVPPPSVISAGNATDVAYTTAKAIGKVERPAGEDPAGNDPALDAHCRFEFVTEEQFNSSGFDGAGQSACDIDPVKAPAAEVPVAATLTGLSVGTAYHLRLVVENAGGSDSKEADATFTTLTPIVPSVAIDPVTTFDAVSAHFSGKVNPNGSDPAFNSNWHFECMPACGQPAGQAQADGAEHAVSGDVLDLEPNTDYEVKLLAANQGGTGEAGPVSFKTSTLAPTALTLYAHEVEANSATLAAKVNPHNSPLTYQFEYGLDSGYGNLAPASPASLGEIDNVNHAVSEAIAGLQADSIYHFRIVATNTETDETTNGVDHTFRTPPAAGPTACVNEQRRAENNSLNLPDCRAYELVSPLKKSGFDAGAPNGDGRYSVTTADGTAVLYGTRGPIGNAYRGLQDYAVGRRGADGWSSDPAISGGAPDRIFATFSQIVETITSSDLNSFVFAAMGSFHPDKPISPSAALYRAHSDGTVDWLSQPQIPNPVPASDALVYASYVQPVGASPDLSTVYFWSYQTLLPEDAARTGNGDWGMYEYRDGVLRAAGTLPDGSEDPGGAAPAGLLPLAEGGRGFPSTNADEAGNQVSRDGSTLFFVSPDPGLDSADTPRHPVTQLYVRRNGSSTLVSHTEAGVDVPAPSGIVPGTGTFFAAADGSKAIFQSVDALAPGAPGDSALKAYRYDVATNSVTYLPGVGGGLSKSSTGLVRGASDDGERFLFSRFNDTEVRISLWDHGTIKSIFSSATGTSPLGRVRATASGSTFVFVSPAPIDGANTGGVNQVFRYDVAADKTTCLSCPPDAVVPTGDVHFAASDEGLVARRGITSDADRVFFDTPDPLVPEDVNGTRDVYVWTPSGVALISSGQSPEPSHALDNSANGDDVFFATAEGLDPRDTDGLYDVYDARVGGGFAQTQAVVPCLDNEVCKGASPAPPTQPGPGTDRFSSDDEKPRPRPTKAIKVGSHQVVGGNLKLKVTLTKGGTLTASGKGLESFRRTYPRAGSYQLKVPLKPSAKKALRQKHKIKLKVHLRFSPKSGKPSSANVVLTVKG